MGAPSRVEVIRNDGDFSDSNRVREVGVDRPEKAKGRQRVIEDERNYLSDSVNARIGATFALHQTDQAYAAMAAGQLAGRIVIRV